MNTSGKCKILMIGPLPPSYGGVSIHILRLSRLIESEYIIDFVDEDHLVKQEYFNLRSFNLIQYFKRVKNSELIYIHSGPTILKFFHITIGRLFFKKIILTIHSYPIRKGFLFRLIDQGKKTVKIKAYDFEACEYAHNVYDFLEGSLGSYERGNG